MLTTAANPETSSPATKVKGNGAGTSVNGNGDASKSVKFGSPKLNSSSRFARMNGISNTNGNSNGTNTSSPSLASRTFFPLFPGVSSALDESPWTSGYNTPTLGAAIHNVAERTEAALEKVAEQRKGGILERVARTTISVADQIERLIQYEIFSRVNAIGGIDNMWLLLDGISAFNPVCTATYTFKEPAKLQDMKDSMLRQIGHFPKYTQKLADVGRFFHGTVFINDEDFNIDNHMRAHTLPGNAGKAELESFASEFLAHGTIPAHFGRRQCWRISSIRRAGQRVLVSSEATIRWPMVKDSS